VTAGDQEGTVARTLEDAGAAHPGGCRAARTLEDAGAAHPGARPQQRIVSSRPARPALAALQPGGRGVFLCAGVRACPPVRRFRELLEDPGSAESSGDYCPPNYP